MVWRRNLNALYSALLTAQGAIAKMGQVYASTSYFCKLGAEKLAFIPDDDRCPGASNPGARIS
jgi:hypothetical protein